MFSWAEQCLLDLFPEAAQTTSMTDSPLGMAVLLPASTPQDQLNISLFTFSILDGEHCWRWKISPYCGLRLLSWAHEQSLAIFPCYSLSLPSKHSPCYQAPYLHTTHPCGSKGPHHSLARETENWSIHRSEATCVPRSTMACIWFYCICVSPKFQKTRSFSYWHPNPFSHPSGLAVYLHLSPLCWLSGNLYTTLQSSLI